jgi:hypothetical protein
VPRCEDAPAANVENPRRAKARRHSGRHPRLSRGSDPSEPSCKSHLSRP